MESSLTPEQRTDRARLAANTRWGNKFDWETSDIDECKDKLAEIRSEAEKAGIILQRRMSAERVTASECYNPSCKKPIDITSGRFAGSRSRVNQETGLMETAYACSAACYLYLGSHFTHASGAIREPAASMPEVVINEAAIPKV